MNLQSLSQTPWFKCLATKTQTLRADQFVLLRTNAFLMAGVDNFKLREFIFVNHSLISLINFPFLISLVNFPLHVENHVFFQGCPTAPTWLMVHPSLYTAISRFKVVGKSAHDNPERYCAWFWVHSSTKKFERMAREATDICLRVLKESSKSRFDSYSRKVQCNDHIPYYLSGLSRALFCVNLSRNSCISGSLHLKCWQLYPIIRHPNKSLSAGSWKNSSRKIRYIGLYSQTRLNSRSLT